MTYVKLKSNKLFNTLSEHIITSRIFEDETYQIRRRANRRKKEDKIGKFYITISKRREITTFLNYIKSKADPKDLTSKIGWFDLDKLIEELGGIENE